MRWHVHFSEPFVLINIRSIESLTNKSLFCESCGSVISRRNAVLPFDIVFARHERYLYPRTTGQSGREWIHTRQKTRQKYYCIKRECLLSRHPYFLFGLIEVNTPLKHEHKRLLKDALGYDARLHL